MYTKSPSRVFAEISYHNSFGHFGWSDLRGKRIAESLCYELVSSFLKLLSTSQKTPGRGARSGKCPSDRTTMPHWHHQCYSAKFGANGKCGNLG